jgi:hypothetical protein
VKNPFPHIPRLQKTLGNPKKQKTHRENKREISTWIKFLGNKTKPTKKGKQERKKERNKKKSTPRKKLRLSTPQKQHNR